MSDKSLFICGTPLQSLIIRKIIELKGLQKSDCTLFFYTYVKNKKHDYYYHQLAEHFSESFYYHCHNQYPRYVIESRKILSRLEFDDIYFAAVTSNFVLTTLSLNIHKRMYTFDDGTANVSPKSSYAAKHGLSLKKLLGLGVFGNRYSLQKIRNETLAHYTIYPGFKNMISDNLVPIEILSPSNSSGGCGGCSVIFGTVFREAFKQGEVENTLNRISRFSQSLDGDVYYLPHPRSLEAPVEGCQLVESEKIAEEIVGDLYQKHGALSLYGFCSSAQVNLASVPGITNFFLTSAAYKYSVLEMSEIMAVAGIPSPAIINLDQYDG